MSSVSINVLGISQIPPVESATATVEIKFQAQGPTPLPVQVYARGASDASGQLIETVTIGTAGQATSTRVTLVAGNEYFIQLCPRTEHDGTLDDQIDGEPWESFCSAAFPFTTQASSPTSPSGHPPTPTIDSFQPLPATLKQDGHIIITWSGSSGADKYHIIWGAEGTAGDEFEVGGASYSLGPASARTTYFFKIQGCDSKLIGDDLCSPFSAPVTFTMPGGTRSLRTFLSLSGIDLSRGVSLKALNTAHARSLAAFMKL